MDSSNPDFTIQPSNKDSMRDGHSTNAQPQHTITLTLTSPAPGAGGGIHMNETPPSGQPSTPSLIVSALPGIQQTAAGVHGQTGMHYAGSSISATPLPPNVQPKSTSSQNYVMSGGGGQPLIVSGASLGSGSAHHDRTAAIYGSQSSQAGLSSKGTPSQSYVMSSGSIQSSSVGGHDSGDESHPVSIHVSSNMRQHDPGPSSSDSHQSGQTERLKVEDALNYLDQVKYKFGNQPQVYNDFLDIMKEFKSQSIDTPGVISRVSNLFRGHPELIVGFNTFLPPGYKIEVQTHDQGSQISYRVDGVTSYVVTNMPSCVPVPSSSVPQVHHPTLPQSAAATITTSSNTNSNPQIIQHTASTGPLPLRSIATHSGIASTTTYGGGSISGSVGGSVTGGGLSGIGGISNGSVSPPPPSVTLTTNASNSTNFEGLVEPSSSFTHSYSSPFVQNAFPSLQSQPVQFNHAINYVNKIKNRFCGQPDKYKQFLDILHSYQKEQRNIKEGLPGKTLSEHEVYSQVAKIFENQEDLLQEFGQFLPESNQSAIVSCHLIDYGLQQRLQDTKPLLEQPKKPLKVQPREYSTPNVIQPPSSRSAHGQSAPKRLSTAAPTHAISKKPKLATPYKDISMAEAARYGTLHDYAFFDKCRSMLKHQHVFDNFIRCLNLFNEEIVSRQELLVLVQPFFSKNPEMYGWLKEFVNRRDDQGIGYEPISQALIKQERVPEEQALEIGEEYFSTCKRLGASYCALPKNHVPVNSNSRTTLCKEVLNDVWVSFPTWSEDSTFVTSRKTQYEEYICRCEDERFELDVIIEANADTIRTFEAVARRMARMSHEDLKTFELKDTLGGTSAVIHLRTVRRVYGDKATEIIEGLKRQPFVVIPIVLKRLKLKEEEWRESQRNFNKIWRDQVERFYLKSLDHQGITFKQSDVRMLRSKALVNEIETIYDERHDQENGEPDPALLIGPHLTFQFTDRSMLDEACNLLLHHVRRQSGIQNDDKRKIKQLLKHFIPDLFNHTRMELSDDETEAGCVQGSSEDGEERNKSPIDFLQNGARNGSKRGSTKRGNAKIKKEEEDEKSDIISLKSDESRRTAYKRALQKQAESVRRHSATGKESRGGSTTVKLSSGSKTTIKRENDELEDKKPPRVIQALHGDQDESYTLFYTNNAWYVFFRLHQIMVERLGRMSETAAKIMNEKIGNDSKCPPAAALRMRPTDEVDVSEFFSTFIEMVKNLLDGNVEPSSYEDTMRELFGINAYISYTMDKVVTNAVRQLQTLVSDEICIKFTELFLQAQKKGGAGGLCDTADQRVGAEITYQKQAEKIDPEENCYKIIFYHKSFRMSMELLEGANIEENTAETTKWSAYIDSFTSHPLTGMDIKIKDLMKPVCLTRNLRLGQQFHSNKAYPPEIAKIFGLLPESEDIKPTIAPSTDKTSNNKRPHIKSEGASSAAAPSSKFMLSQTLAPVTPEEAEELEKQLERNSKRRSELVHKEIEAAAAATSATQSTFELKVSQAKINLATNNPVTPEEAELLEKQLEVNARRRAEAATASKSPYVIKENLQCKFHPNSYKLTYVVNSENYFYLRGALQSARKNHKKVTTRMNEAFGKWHQSWLESSVSEDKIMRCEDWLMSTKNSDTKIVSNNDISLAPYRPFNRYVVKK